MTKTTLEKALNPSQLRAYVAMAMLMERDDRVTQRALAKELGIYISAAHRHFADFARLGLIESYGPKRYAAYKLKYRVELFK